LRQESEGVIDCGKKEKEEEEEVIGK